MNTSVQLSPETTSLTMASYSYTHTPRQFVTHRSLSLVPWSKLIRFLRDVDVIRTSLP